MADRFYFDNNILLDRAPNLRRDPAWATGAPEGANARIIPIWRDHSLVHAGDEPRAAFLNSDIGQAILEAASTVVFLGLDDGIAYYAADLSHHEETSHLPLPDGTVFEDLRKLSTNLASSEAGVLAYARALGTWHRNHLFCGTCGAPTVVDKGGHERVCTNEACGKSHFPRTDPAVIMLVAHPDGERCLLGRNKRFKGIRFSTMAGFVEPGETLEQAVSREVKEETGIRTTNVKYQASQPWPFPASIMLGFRATAINDNVNCEDEELIEAKWFTRAEVRAMGETGEVLPPSRYSISRWLIDTWLDEGK